MFPPHRPGAPMPPAAAAGLHPGGGMPMAPHPGMAPPMAGPHPGGGVPPGLLALLMQHGPGGGGAPPMAGPAPMAGPGPMAGPPQGPIAVPGGGPGAASGGLRVPLPPGLVQNLLARLATGGR